MDAITNAIYESVFGLTANELVAKAKERAGDKWNYIGWSSEDQAMRDWLSLEALQALNAVEGELTRKLFGMAIPPTENQIIELAKFVGNQYKVTVIWDGD